MLPWWSTPVAVVLALTPAVLRWHWGRRLARLADDPALPERLLASQRRNQLAIFCATVGIVLLAPNSALWVMLLLLVAYLTAGYPLRKRLYNETWSVAAYLGFFSRLIVGAYGFWFLLLLAPTILSQLGRADWLAGAAIAGVLLAWNERAADVIRWCLRAQPITDPALVARFAQIVSAAKDVGSPALDYIDMGGGAVANALALPSLTRPGVLFSSTLLGLLDADETIAISAHADRTGEELLDWRTVALRQSGHRSDLPDAARVADGDVSARSGRSLLRIAVRPPDAGQWRDLGAYLAGSHCEAGLLPGRLR